MQNLMLGFEVHQPFRVRRDYFWQPRLRGRLEERFFDIELNKQIFERAKNKCYMPATKILLEEIEKAEKEGRDVSLFFSISGTFLEQAEMWGKDVLELFSALASTKKVEFLAQTYYHSVTSMWEDLYEWREQVKAHREAIKNNFGQDPVTFENTELLMNRRIAEEVEKLGFKAAITEGREDISDGNPNRIFRLKGGNLKIFLRNYKLSDDIAFRFSDRGWDQYPLTAEKFADWVAKAQGKAGLIFIDYETFGEHNWPESGIHDFLRWLPRELGKRGVRLVMPQEMIKEDGEELDFSSTISWADIRKDESSWLGNIMQWAYDDSVRRGEMLAKKFKGEWLKAWRYFTASDSYYYLFIGESSPMVVHSYFNSFNSPIDAFINEFYAVNQFNFEMLRKAKINREPFIFMKGGKRGPIAWNSKMFEEIVKRNPQFIEMKKYMREWLR